MLSRCLLSSSSIILQRSCATTGGAVRPPERLGHRAGSGHYPAPPQPSQAILALLRVLLAVGSAPSGLAGWHPCARPVARPRPDALTPLRPVSLINPIQPTYNL